MWHYTCLVLSLITVDFRNYFKPILNRVVIPVPWFFFSSINIMRSNVQSLNQGEQQVPIGWWRITVLRWVFSRVTSGRLFLRTKRAEPGDAHNVSLRSEAPLSFSSASWQHLTECNTKRSGISLHPAAASTSSSARKPVVIVELYYCKTDGAQI